MRSRTSRRSGAATDEARSERTSGARESGSEPTGRSRAKGVQIVLDDTDELDKEFVR